MKIRTENSGQQIKAENSKLKHGDLLTLAMPENSVSKLINLLAENQIQAEIINLKNFGQQIRVPVQFTDSFCSIAERIVNEQYGNLKTFQDEFLVGVYSADCNSIIEFLEPELYLPSIHDLKNHVCAMHTV